MTAADPSRRLMTMADVAAYVRYDGPRAADCARQWLRKHAVPLHRRGTRCLVRLSDVDLALDGYNFAAERARSFRRSA